MFIRLTLALTLAVVPALHGRLKPGEARTATAATINPFVVGERLSYDVAWRDFIVAGELTLETKERRVVDGIDSFHVTAVARSVGLGSLVLKVNDRYDSFIDAATLKPFRAEKHSRRGKKSRTTSITIDNERGTARLTDGRSIEIPADTYDLAGLMYAIRAIELRPGSSRTFTLLEDDKRYTILVEAGQREKIRTRAGAFDAVRVSARVVEKANSRDKARLRLYVTDDARRLPVLLTADPSSGEVRVELTSVTGREGK